MIIFKDEKLEPKAKVDTKKPKKKIYEWKTRRG